jgi:hypothetical protein
MIYNSTQALSTSLLRARLGQVATLPRTEQQLIERLCAAAHAIGCSDGDIVRALYVGLKLRLGVCLYGVPTAQALPLLQTMAVALVGAGSEQIVRLQAPRADDSVMRRFAALRISDLVASALAPAQEDKAWFLLLHGDDAPTLLAWAQLEIRAALGAEARRSCWPSNVFVLAAVPDWPLQSVRHWLPLRAPYWTPPPVLPAPVSVPPVGYQRQLIAARLGGATYLHRLRAAKSAMVSRSDSLPSKLVRRWLAAAVDAYGRELWVAGDAQANAHHALAVLHALVGPTTP